MTDYFSNTYGSIVTRSREKYMFRTFKILIPVNINKKVHVSYFVHLLLHLHEVEAADDESFDTDESGVGFKKIGTAIGE